MLCSLLAGPWLLASGARAQDRPASRTERPQGFWLQIETLEGRAASGIVPHAMLDFPDTVTSAAETQRYQLTAQLRLDRPGSYRFATWSSDRTELQIDGQIVWPMKNDQPVWHESQPIELSDSLCTLQLRLEPSAVAPSSAERFANLYWSGPGFDWEPLTADHCTASYSDPESERVDLQIWQRGAALYRAYGCAACHDRSDLADSSLTHASSDPVTAMPNEAEQFGPALNHLTGYLSPAWVAERLGQKRPDPPRPDGPLGLEEPSAGTTVPHDAFATSASASASERRMPFFDLTEAQVDFLVAFLFGAPRVDSESTQAAASDNSPREPGDAQRGREVLLTAGCLACHRWQELGQSDLFSGPDLTQLSHKRSAAFLRQWLVDPEPIQPDHRMPPVPLTARQRADLEALFDLPIDLPVARAATPAELTQRQTGEQGRELAERFCAACHRLPEQRGVGVATESTATTAGSANGTVTTSIRSDARPVDWDASCVGPTAGAAQPRYVLSASDRRALRTYWSVSAAQPSLQRVLETGFRGPIELAQQGCLRCHDRNERPGGLTNVASAVIAADGRLAPQLPAMVPPSLRSVGDKFRDRVWTEWLGASPPRRRSWLSVRMPRYDLPESIAGDLAAYFRRLDRLPQTPLDSAATSSSPRSDSRPSEPSPPPTAQATDEQLAAARQLVTGAGFGCVSCHTVGTVQPTNTSLTAIGPDLSEAYSLLRPSWFRRWVRNPTRIVANMEMPAVQVAVPSVLDGQLPAQLDALWQAFGTPGFNPPESSVVRVVQQAAVQALDDRAIVLTDVLRHPETTLLSPALVALPNGHNLLWDLQSGGMRSWWQGIAAYQKTAGKSWFWEPGADRFLLDRSEPLAMEVRVQGQWLRPRVAGQFATRLEYWQHESQGSIRLGYILRYPQADQPQSDDPTSSPEINIDGDAERRELFIQETIEPVWGSDSIRVDDDDDDDDAERGLSGFRRTIEVVTSPARQESRPLQVRLPIAEASVWDQQDQVARWRGAQVRVEDSQSAGPERWESDSATLWLRWQVDDLHRSPVQLLYEAPAAVPPPVNAQLDQPPAQAAWTNAVPGFRAVRLPLSPTWMPTSIAWDSQNRLYVSSLKGRIWLAQDFDADGLEDTCRPVSDELAAPYGMAFADRSLLVIHKPALIRLDDEDGDLFFERMETLADGWGHTDDYHDWAIGLASDGQDGYFVATACQQDDRPEAAAHWRGKVLHLRPPQPSNSQQSLQLPDPRLHQRRWDVEVWTAGHRFPMGIASRSDGLLLVTDNQGNYNAFNELNHVVRGRRYGFLNWWEQRQGIASDETPPAICIPHPWTRSVNGICFLQSPAVTGAARRPTDAKGEFGPLTGHLVGCEYDTRRLIRLSLQEVEGTLQGAAYPLSRSIEELADDDPGLLGPLCAAVSPAGRLYVGGIRDSGWGGGNNRGELVQLQWDPDSLPLGMGCLEVTADGFRVTYTQADLPPWVGLPESYRVESFRRTSTPAYGGDDQDRQTEKVVSVQRAGTATVELRLSRLRPGHVYEFHLVPPSRGDARNPAASFLFPDHAFYTLWKVPSSSP